MKHWKLVFLFMLLPGLAFAQQPISARTVRIYHPTDNTLYIDLTYSAVGTLQDSIDGSGTSPYLAMFSSADTITSAPISISATPTTVIAHLTTPTATVAEYWVSATRPGIAFKDTTTTASIAHDMAIVLEANTLTISADTDSDDARDGNRNFDDRPSLVTITSEGDVGITTGTLTVAETATVGQLIDSGLTASTVPYANGSKQLTSSAVTPTELGYVSGVTSALQTQLNAKQPLDATLTALAAYNTNGILTQTAADTFAGRTITGTSNQITVTNGDGVSGNPTLSLPSAVTLPGTLTFADDQWAGLGVAAGRIEFDDQAVDEVNILNARVGIGQNAPLSLLHTLGTNDETGGWRMESSAGTAATRLYIFPQGNFSTTFKKGNASSVFDFQNSAGTSELTIDGSGRVGIGTNAPTSGYQLTVAGAGAARAQVLSTDGSGARGEFFANSSFNVILGSVAAHDLVFRTNSAEVFRAINGGGVTVTTGLLKAGAGTPALATTTGDIYATDDLEAGDDLLVGDDATVVGLLDLGYRIDFPNFSLVDGDADPASANGSYLAIMNNPTENAPATLYLIPDEYEDGTPALPTPTHTKFELFHTNYFADSTNYEALTIRTRDDATHGDIFNIAANKSGTGQWRKLYFTRDTTGSITDILMIIDSVNNQIELRTPVIYMDNLPTSDPASAGQLWNDAGTLKVSAG